MATRTLSGIVIQPGLMIGKARKIAPQNWIISRVKIGKKEVKTELESLQTAISTAEHELQQQLQNFTGDDDDREILSSHLMILNDPELISTIRQQISAGLVSAAASVQRAFKTVLDHFSGLDDPFFAQRAVDFRDVQNRLLGELTGSRAASLDGWEPNQIAVLEEAGPSLVSSFGRHEVKAYCSEQGSFTSHASILTRSLKITAVSGLSGLCAAVRDGDVLILDGIEGRLIIAPDHATLKLYEQRVQKYRQQGKQALSEAGLPAQTQDGRRIKLRLNLDLLPELEELDRLKADGVGLYRTEFLYLGKDALPGEELQFETYRQMARLAAPHSVTIRTFDLGGDKLSHLIPSPHEENPYLGNRGIRFSLAHEDVFRVQVRAVLRASAFGRLKLMFPMVSDLRDFLRARRIVQSCQEELAREGLPYDDNIPLGVMIEVPSAALCADDFAQNCDFLSIGTNDLVQYTLAADRNNSELSPYYLTHHPSVLRLLRITLAAGQKHGKPVSVCGEMASQSEYLPLLIGLGFSDLSVGPSAWLGCKSIIRRCDARLSELVQNADLDSFGEIENLIHDLLKPYYSL
ncbi:MAG: phosphoenolpyruvate--protein phosphotransferase [Candidatus Cloacimonetes bacterium]|nr:phosphoenolpyruvate--protein phosphotransferase [Candidatus Cloacimonadota bacterium]